MTRTALFVSHSAQVSGAEKVMLAVLAETLAVGFAVEVACPRGALRDALPPEAAWTELPVLALSGQQGAKRIAGTMKMAARWVRAARILRRQVRAAAVPPVVIINSTHALPAVGLSGITDARWLIHDVAASGKQQLFLRLGKRALGRCVAVSEPAAAPVRAAGVSVVLSPNGVHIPTESAYRPPTQPPTVGMLAVITDWKAQDLLIDAVALTTAVTAQIAGRPFPGDESYLDALIHQVAAANLNDRIDFLGQVSPGTVLPHWDALVCCARKPETGPLAALEAMVYNVPVVATESAAAPYLAPEYAWIVPDDDPAALAAALSAATTDTAERRDRIAAARARVVECHDIAHTAPAMLAALVAPAATVR